MHKVSFLNENRLRNRADSCDLGRYLFVPSHKSHIVHFHLAFVAELKEGSIFTFAPAGIIEEFVENDHSTWNYSVPQQIKDRSCRAIEIGIQVQKGNRSWMLLTKGR